MNQAEIEAKVVELALLCEQQGVDSAAAQKLVEYLAKENAQNVGKVRMSLARKVMLKKVTVKQDKKDVAVDIKSSTISQVMKAIETARNGTVDAQKTPEVKTATVKNKSNDLGQLETLMANAAKTDETKLQAKPAAKKQKAADKPKDKPVAPAKKDEPQVKPAEPKNEAIDFPSKEIQADIREFFKPDADDYSDALADFMENKENALKMLNFLHDKYTKYSGPQNSKIMRLALTAYSVNGKDADIADSVKSLIEKFSELSVEKYLEKNKKAEKVFFKDPFLSDVKTNTTPDYLDLLNGITERHVQNVLGRLPEEDKVKYLRSLSKKNGLEQYNPREQNKKVAPNDEEKNIKPTQQEKQIGDTIMADEVKLTQEQIEELKKYNKDIDLSGVTPENYAEKLAALKKEAEENAGAEVKSDGKDEVSKDGEDSKAKEGEEKVANEKGNGGIKIDGEGGKKPEPKINTDYDWIEQKKRDYQERADKKEIAGYTWDETVKDGFAAHVEGGYIHYTSKDSVIVSKESGLKVFEALVTEKHNVGRPVNFGENLDHDQAVKLLAACLIHGNEIGNNPPKLSEADMKLLEAELQGRKTTVDGKEVSLYEFLKPQLEKYAEGREDKKENADISNDDPKTFDDETKGKIKEALEHQYKLSFLEAKGVAVKDEKGDIKKADSADQKDYEEYVDLKNKTIRVGDKEISEKDFLAEKFKENPAEVRAIVGSVVEDMHKEKIDSIKKKMAQVKGAKEGTTQLDEHNEMRQAKLEERAKKDHDISVALGIIEPNDEDKAAGKKALSVDEVEKFAKDNNVDKFTFERLINKANGKPLYVNGVRSFDESKLSKEQKEVFDKLPVPQSIAREKGGRE